ncbi:MAG: enoyl-CoA hydratase/isomerase family protein [Caldilineaceae bacterium]
MFTVYATSGGGLAVEEETAQTAIKGKEQTNTKAVASATQPLAQVDDGYPYWYEMTPTASRGEQPTLHKEHSKPISQCDSPVHDERSGTTALITLQRPAVLNAIDMEMATLLKTALQKAGADQRVRAVILTGAGRGFCAGGDLRFAVAANPEQAMVFADPDSPVIMTGGFYSLQAVYESVPRLTEAFRTGQGLGWGEHCNCLWCNQP